MRSVSWVAACAVGLGLSAQSRDQELTAENPLRLSVHHITASVLDLDRAVAWYHDILGFRVDQQGERESPRIRFAELSIPGFGVGLVQTAVGLGAPVAHSQAPAWTHIVFAVPDPGAAFRRLQSLGADVHTRSGASVEETRVFLMNDSEGNEIEIIGADAGGR